MKKIQNVFKREDEFDRLDKKFKELVSFCEKAVGIDSVFVGADSDDEPSRKVAWEVEEIGKDIDSYREEHTKNVPKLRRFFRLHPDSQKAAELREDISSTLQLATRTTNTRKRHGVIPTLALKPRDSLTMRFKTAHSSQASWTVDLTLQNVPVIDSCHPARATEVWNTINLLREKLNITYDHLFQWWRKSHLDQCIEKTKVWDDMRVMCLKLLHLLDFTDQEEESIISQPGFDSVSAIIGDAEAFANSVVDLLDNYPNDFERIRPFIELFVPVLLVLDEACFNHIEVRKHVSSTLSSVMKVLSSSLACLQDEFRSQEFQEEPSMEDKVDSTRKSLSNNGDLETMLEEHIPGSTRTYGIDDLKRLRLKEIKLDDTGHGRLGDGSYGNVRRYFDVDHTTQYAVKLFFRPTKKSDDKRTWNRIIREAYIWKSLRHKNINRLHGYCSLPDFEYPGLVMDLCEESLDEFCNFRKVNSEQRLCFMLDVAKGLNYLHERRYVHGDLRSDNVLVKRLGPKSPYFAVLTDFGVSDTQKFILNKDKIYHQTDGQKAPDPYLPPELLRDKTGPKLSAPADMYAYGCVFVEIVCELALTTEHHEDTKERVFLVPPGEIKEHKYKQLLASLWDSDPKKRFSAKRLCDILDGYLALYST